MTELSLIQRCRYFCIRHLCCPVPFLPQCIPGISGKSLLELIIIFLILLIAIFAIAYTGGVGAGHIADYLGAILIFFSLRKANPFTNTSFPFITSIMNVMNWENSLFYHKLFAILYLFALLVHGLTVGETNTTGLILGIVSGVATLSYLFYYVYHHYITPYCLTSRQPKEDTHYCPNCNIFSFTMFYVIHVACYLTIIPVVYIHGGRYTFYIAILWVIDLLYRYLLTVQRVEECYVSQMTNDVLRVEIHALLSSYINMTKSQQQSCPNGCCYHVNSHRKHQPGQYYFLMIPKVNYYEYHPFSITSHVPCNEENDADDSPLVFYMKVCGDWTRQVRQHHTIVCGEMNDQPNGGSRSGSSSGDYESGGYSKMTVYLEGPYGALSIDLFNTAVYPVTMLISGGIGITPMLSILHEYISLGSKQSPSLLAMKKLFFIWIVRDCTLAQRIYEDTIAPLIGKYLIRYNAAYAFRLQPVTTTTTAVAIVDGIYKSPSSSPIRVKSNTTNNTPNNAHSEVWKEGPRILFEIFLTNKEGRDILSEGFPWQFGRPGIEEIFGQAIAAMPTDQSGYVTGRGAVCVSGPSTLIQQVRGQSVKSSLTSGCRFDCHTEEFNL